MGLHIEANKNQEAAFSSMLKSLAVSIGAIDALFHIDLAEPEVWLGKSWLKCLKRRESIFFTSHYLEDTFQRYRSRLKSADKELTKSVNKQLYNWPSSSTPSGRIIKENGYRTVVSVSISLPSCSELSGRFLFFFDNYNEQCEFDIRQSVENVLNEMFVYQAAVSSSQLITSPLEDYGMLKKSTISIIRHLAQGCSRKELSNIHYMTPRGIDYHLERAKYLLGAKNMHHLVYKSQSLLLI